MIQRIAPVWGSFQVPVELSDKVIAVRFNLPEVQVGTVSVRRTVADQSVAPHRLPRR
jgi:hypothetical protein